MSPWGSGSWGFEPKNIGMYSPSANKKSLKALQSESIARAKGNAPRSRRSVIRKFRKFGTTPEQEAMRYATVFLFSVSFVGFITVSILLLV